MVKNKEKIDVPKTELPWFTVSLEESIGTTMRLDAGVFNPRARHARAVLQECGSEIVPLWGDGGFVKEAAYPTRFKRVYVDRDNGVPFFLPSQITDLKPKATKFISKVTEVDFSSLEAHKNDILLTRSGTIGACTLVSETLRGKVFSDDVIRIKTNKEVDAGYVYAYLKTETGQELINTNNYGAVVQHIEPEHLKSIQIPMPSSVLRGKIGRLVMKSFQLRDEANNSLDKAEKMLVKELKLPPISNLKPEYFDSSFEPKNYTVPLAQLENRFDASYHKPIFSSIIAKVNKSVGKLSSIGDDDISSEVILPGRFKRVYVEEGQGMVFFGGKQIYELDPSNKKYLSLTHHGERIKDQLSLKENMILITCSGTIGRVTMVPKHWSNWTANQHIIRVVPISNDWAGFLYVWLATDYGNELIKKFIYGAVVDEIDDRQVASIVVPRLKSDSKHQEINNLALSANRKRYEAYTAEQEAIDIINNDILKIPAVV